jgi:hypothetical protein
VAPLWPSSCVLYHKRLKRSRGPGQVRNWSRRVRSVPCVCVCVLVPRGSVWAAPSLTEYSRLSWDCCGKPGLLCDFFFIFLGFWFWELEFPIL